MVIKICIHKLYLIPYDQKKVAENKIRLTQKLINVGNSNKDDIKRQILKCYLF